MKERLVNQSTEGQQRFDRQRRRAAKPVIEEQARGQVRTFLDELKNGTRNYRTVASLGSQVAQEYRGRAILELLQNSHDVLAFAEDDDPRRISFVLRTSPEPELLVANSGRPFHHEDFSGICQLAQSPKDPNESVGNKGLGFQSVLEVSTRPEVWSTAPTRDGIAFTFGFDPDVCEPIGRVARALLAGDPPTDPEFGTEHVVDWSPEQIEEYRRRLEKDGIDPVDEGRNYLSPYVIPRFLGDPPPQVAKLLEDGHVTVIRLPLDGGRAGSADDAAASVRKQLEALDEAAVVFLPHLSVLRREIDEEVVELKRQVEAERPLSATREEPDHGGIPGARHTRLRVGRTGPDATAERLFHVWSRILGGAGQPEVAERIEDAVRHLPNRWPEVRQVEVAVAVEETREARQGALVVFLPTTMKTGIGAHVNAPSYGSLDRKTIDFDDAYNELMLEFVTDLALDAVLELVRGPAEPWRGRAVIDLLAQAGSPPSDDPELTRRLRERARDRDDCPPLEQMALILCDSGWRRPGVARTMPSIPADDPFGEAEWRTLAGFAVASSALDERREPVEVLLRSLGGSPAPTDGEWARTLERMAEQARRRQAGVQADPSRGVEAPPDWNKFLSSVLSVLPPELRSEPKDPDADPLAKARFLPTEDGRLLSASNAVRMFFQPRQGADDAADFVGSVPVSLKERIAFLHHDVETHEGSQRRRTEIQKFLDGRFVQSFRREDLLREVITPSLPELPAEHGSPEAAVCADALAWTLEVIGQEEPEGLLDQLAKLPVACTAGWFAVSEAVFGPGWDGRSGEHLETLADDLPDGEGEKLVRGALLPPGDELWFPRGNKRGTAVGDPPGIELASRSAQFHRAGLVDGLRLEACETIRFGMCRDHPKLPGKGPATIQESAWDDWKEAVLGEVKPRHKGWFDYDLRGVRALALLHRRDLGDSARAALSKLILASLPRWREGWDEVTIRKVGGEYFSQRISSPLKHWLSTLPWLHEGSDEAHTPRQEPRPLRERWLVPESLLRGLGSRFRHLSPLLLPLARRLALEEECELLRALRTVGLNVYPTEDDSTGPALLEALAGVIENGGPMPAGGFDVLIGQIRHAWKHLGEDRDLPKRFLVRTKPRTLVIRTAEDINDVYLPDDLAPTRSLREQEEPILAMRPKEAQGPIGDRLRELGATPTSTLAVRCLIDGPSGARPTDGAQTLDEVGLDWLPVVLLALAAHGGGNPTGPATKAWLDAARRLDRARVRLCHSIRVELLDGERIVARSDPRAHWLPRPGILLLHHNIAQGGLWEEIASASQAVLDRQDLLKDLRLVLGSLARSRTPTRPTSGQIAAALDRAEVDAEALSDIRLRWIGEITMLRDRIRPLAKLLKLDDAILDEDKTDTAKLTVWLADGLRDRVRAEDRTTRAKELMAAARECYDDIGMGYRAWRVLGDVAALPKWNEALRALGDGYEQVANAQAEAQANRYLDEAAPLLRAFARHVATENDKVAVQDQGKLFSTLNAVHENIEKDSEWPRLHAQWSQDWWEVPLDAVLGVLRARYETIHGAKLHLDGFERATTINELRSVLKQQEVALKPDPRDVARGNQFRLDKAVRGVRRLYECWLENKGAEPTSSAKAPEVRLDDSMYLRDYWPEDDLFERATLAVDDSDFHDAVAGCNTIEAMRKRLGIPCTDRNGRRVPETTREVAGVLRARRQHRRELPRHLRAPQEA